MQTFKQREMLFDKTSQTIGSPGSESKKELATENGRSVRICLTGGDYGKYGHKSSNAPELSSPASRDSSRPLELQIFWTNVRLAYFATRPYRLISPFAARSTPLCQIFGFLSVQSPNPASTAQVRAWLKYSLDPAARLGSRNALSSCRSTGNTLLSSASIGRNMR